MTENTLCPRCQRTTEAGSELCPGCLLEAGLRDPEDSLAEAPTLVTAAEEAATVLMDAESQGLRSEKREAKTPEQIGDYEVLSEVARGGMGVVYKARQKSLDRTVALKMILQGAFASKDEEARFRLEAEAAARLDHPHIVPIYEIGEHEGRPFFSMKLIDARPLHKEFPHLRREPRRLGALMLSLARALQHAHERGVLHRDLKPANVLLDQDGQPHLTDFGLARKLEGEGEGLTQTGAVLGTPSYMAPEQARGEADLTTAVDVYGLGAILYEALAGRPPFTGKTPFETIYRVLEREAARPRSIDAGIDPELEIICLRCLEKEPRRRYPTAEALAEDLSRWLKHEPILARRPSLSYRTGKWVRRRPAMASLVAVCFLAALALLGTGLWFNTRVVLERNRAREQERAARQSKNRAERELRRALISGASAKRLAGKRWEALENLRQAAELGGSDPELRSEAAAAAVAPGLRLVARIGPGKPDGINESMHSVHGYYDGPHIMSYDHGFSRDGALFAALLDRYKGIEDQQVVAAVWALPAGERLAHAPAKRFVFSPRDPVLALETADGVRLWDPRADVSLLEIPGVSDPMFQPSGSGLLVRRGRESELWSVDDKARVGGPFKGWARLFIDERRALWVDRGSLALDLTTGARTTLAPELEEFLILACADQGGMLVTRAGSDGQGPLHVRRAGEEAAFEIEAFSREVGDGNGLYFAPRTGRLAFAERRDSPAVEVWDAVRKRRLPRLVTPGESLKSGAIQHGAFHPGGILLAAQQGRVSTPDSICRTVIWNTDSGRELTVIPGGQQPVWSPDGRFLALRSKGSFGDSGGDSSHFSLWQVRGPQPSFRLGSDPEGIRGLGPTLALKDRALQIEETPPALRFLPRRPTYEAIGFDGGGRLWSARHHPMNTQEPYEAILIESLGLRGGERREYELPRQDSWGDASHVKAVAVDPAGARAFVILTPSRKEGASFISDSRVFELWDLNSRRRLSSRADKRMTGDPRLLRYSPDGVYLVVASSDKVTFLDPRDGAPSGALFFETEKEFRTSEGRETRSYGHSVRDLVFSAEGSAFFLALASMSGVPGQLAVVSLPDREIKAMWAAQGADSTAVAFAEPSRVLASGDADGAIRLWTLEGRPLASWEGHGDEVVGLRFGPAGRCLLSVSKAGELKLWDLPKIRQDLAEYGLDWKGGSDR